MINLNISMKKENVQYSKKLESFLEKYNNLKTSFSTYSTELNEFTEVINTLANSSPDTTEKYDSEKGKGIIINEKVLLKSSGFSSLNDLSMNNISENNVYYDKELTAASYITGQPSIGSIIQQDISDILVLNKHETKYGTWKSISGVTSGLIDLTASDGSCSGNTELLEQCSGYAKMTNEPYFGITEVTSDDSTGADSNTKCQCYVFDNIDNLDNPNSLIISSPATVDNLKYIAYFGVMLDGNIYSFKDKTFQNNYNNFFEEDKTKMKKINGSVTGMVDSKDESKCHPLTGSGPHSLSISKISECIQTKIS